MIITVKKPAVPAFAASPALTAGGLAGRGGCLLLPQGWPYPVAAGNLPLHRHYYHLQDITSGRHEPGPWPRGKFVIVAPSLAGILAHAILAGTPDTTGLLLDKAWAGSKMRLLWLAARLRYERMRLGSDAESLFLHRLIQHERLGAALPCLTIGQWLSAVDRVRRLSFPAPDFVLWLEKTQSVDAGPWLARRFCSPAQQQEHCVLVHDVAPRRGQ